MLLYRTRLIEPFLFCLCVLLCLVSCRQKTVVEEPEIPYPMLREGDLAFRRGNSLVSDAVVAAERHALYSHCGVVFKVDSVWSVVHAVPGEREFPGDIERVKAEPIEAFFSPRRACHGELLHTGLTDSLLVVGIKQRALRMVSDSVRFDSKYDLADTNFVYCTEFVYLLYKSIGMDLSEGRRSHIQVPMFAKECLFPSDIYACKRNTSYFKY